MSLMGMSSASSGRFDSISFTSQSMRCCSVHSVNFPSSKKLVSVSITYRGKAPKRMNILENGGKSEKIIEILGILSRFHGKQVENRSKTPSKASDRRLGVPVGLLPHVQASHGDAEGAHAADEVQQPAVGHQLIAVLDQRASETSRNHTKKTRKTS